MKNKDTLEIVFIRHAQTCYEDIGDRDPSDGELTAEGERQCELLGEKLKDIHFDAYISSSLLRAFRTAAGVCRAKGDNPLIEICPELVECGCTPGYYGCSEEYLRKRYDNAKMCETKLYGTTEYDFVCATDEENDIRAQKVIDYLKSRFTFGDRVAVFSHHGILEHLIPTALGVKPHVFRFALDNVSVTVVEYHRDGTAILRCVNREDMQYSL